MRIAIIGTGYVGSVTGACFASKGNDVVCVDINQQLVDALNKGNMHIYESGLSELVQDSLQVPSSSNPNKSRISFTTDIDMAVKESELIFICVGTPMSEDGTANLSYVLDVAESIGKSMDAYKIVVTKSTVPVGTGTKVEQAIRKHYEGEFDVVSNPEFLKEGVAIADFTSPDRVIIGHNSERSDHVEKVFHTLYEPFMRRSERLFFMDRASAELSKYAANTMLATRISFMNEIARLAESVGANIDQVRKGIGSDERIGPAFLYAGPGFGGSCFPKDVSALAKTSKEQGVDLRVVEAVQKANYEQREFVVNKILDHYGDVSGKTIALWGLAFKARTDDVRDSPALFVAEQLVKKGATVVAYDPEAMATTKRQLGDVITYANSAYEATDKADALVIMTEWNEFRSPNFERLATLKDKVIIDARNLFSLWSMQEEKFTYISIGRPIINKNL